MSTDKPREFWIEQDDNELLSVYRFHPGNAHQLFHVIEIESYQSLQEKYDELEKKHHDMKSELIKNWEQFVEKSQNLVEKFQSSVKELSEENERLKEFATKLIFGNPSYYAEDMEDAKRLLPILMNKALSGKDGVDGTV